MELRCSDIAAAAGGELVGDDALVAGASIDSRTIGPGQLFVPVVAERDGHDFIDAALAAGAGAVLVSDPSRRPAAPAIVVDDTVAGLQAAGRLARSRITAPVIGVTGSVGKTSVKDLLAAALAERFRTAASERSFNNEMGVPLTLLNAPDGVEAVVVEMGARGLGHIAALCAIAVPTVGIVTRVAEVHTEVFGTIEDVARAKGELVEALPAEGTAILNGADARVLAMASRASAAVVTYGAGGDVRAEGVSLDDDLRGRFTLRSPWGDSTVALQVRGAHQVDNSLAAAAAALSCGVDVEAVARGLGSAALSPWRMELERSPSGAVVLNDSYNANPTSTTAALHSLVAIPATRRTAVLGLMAELGPDSDVMHRAVGDLARELGIRVMAVGTDAYGAEEVASIDEAVDRLGPVGEGDAVLIKGSRVAGLERLAELLLER